jgi:hypothetical protein
MSRIGAVLAVGLVCAAGQALAGGPYLAPLPEAFMDEVVDNGHCAKFVQAAAGAPQTADWRAGARVRGNPDVAPGTAIATFEPDGTYTSRTGNHAAIYIGQDETGIWVYDQWRGQPVHYRLIRFEGGKGANKGSKSNDGDLYAVIE